MKRLILLILAMACAALAGCGRSGAQDFSSVEVIAAEDEATGTSISPLFPAEVNSIEVTFDFYPSEVTRALNADEIAAVAEWALALEVEQAPLDETETQTTMQAAQHGISMSTTASLRFPMRTTAKARSL